MEETGGGGGRSRGGVGGWWGGGGWGVLFFFFNDTATTEIYTLSLHDALPIYSINYGISVKSFFCITLLVHHCKYCILIGYSSMSLFSKSPLVAEKMRLFHDIF